MLDGQDLEQTYRESDNTQQEQDLDMLIFGNPVLPAAITQHLPSILQGGKPKAPVQEIYDDADTEREVEPEQARCMIVDDEPFNIDALKIALQCATIERPGFNFSNRVDSASNGAKAVELLKSKYEAGFTYKFILMDCNMPRMDGYQATALIRKFITDIEAEQPVIVAVSGHVEDKYIQRALNSGMDRCIAKPAKVEDIREAIEQVHF